MLFLLALVAAADVDGAVPPGRAGVMAIDGDDGALRAAVADALAKRGFDSQANAYVDGVAKDLATAGFTCAAADDTCWLKFAVNAGLDVVVVGAVVDTTLQLRALDARSGRARPARGPVDHVADVVTALVATKPAPPAPLSVAPVPATPAPSSMPHASSSTSVPSSTPRAQSSSLSPWIVAGGVVGLVAVGCAVVAAVLEVNAASAQDAWKKGGTVDGAALQAGDVGEIGFGGCAVVAGAGALGAGAVALLEE